MHLPAPTTRIFDNSGNTDVRLFFPIHPTLVEPHALLNMPNSLADILPQLRTGNQTALLEFYRLNRDHFTRWARHTHQLDADQAHHQLRMALVRFYDQVADGRLTKMPQKLRPHIYNLAVQSATPEAEMEAGPSEVLPAAEAGRRRRLVLLFRQLGSDGQKVLMYFYFRGYNFTKVAGKMGYPNAAVARRQKLSSLRALYDLYQRSRGATPA